MKPLDPSVFNAAPEFRSPLFKTWALKDALRPPRFSFSDDLRKQIESKLVEAELKRDAIAIVIKTLEADVAEHLAWRTLEKAALTPSRRFKQLKALTQRSVEFRENLEALDSDTRREVSAYAAGRAPSSEEQFDFLMSDEMSVFDRRVCGLFDGLLKFEAEVTRYLNHTKAPSAGRRPRPTTQQLVVDIAATLTRTTSGSIPIAPTRNGPFEIILGICLEGVRGVAVSDVHPIARAGIREFRRRNADSANTPHRE